METKPVTPITKGIIITLLLIVFGLVVYFTNQIGNAPLQYVQYIILVGGLIWTCISYAKQLNGNVTFGNVFAHGFKTTAVVIVLMCIYTFIGFKFLFPDMEDKIMEQAKASMEAKHNITDEQINQAMDITKKFFIPFALAGIIVGFAIIGAISSLIGAAIAKKNPANPFNQQTTI